MIAIKFLTSLISEKELFICEKINDYTYNIKYMSSEIRIKLLGNEFSILKQNFFNEYQGQKLIGYILFVLIAKVWDK